MKWNETTAKDCRYGEIAENIFGDAKILWEDSEADYQGHATIIAEMTDGTFAFYEWWYGSCSGCDDWESRGLNDDQIEAEMREHMVTFDDLPTLRRFLCGDPEDKFDVSRKYDTGGLVGMIDILSGGTLNRFERAWCVIDEIMHSKEKKKNG